MLACALLLGLWLGGIFSQPENHDSPPTPQQATAPLEPDVWHSLLAQKPRPLIWSEHDSGSRWSADGREVWAASTYPGLLELTRTDERNYQFRVTIQQTPWIGGIGIFLGYQNAPDDPDTVQAEVLSIEPNETSYLVSRSLVYFEKGNFQGFKNRIALCGVDVNQPAPAPMMLVAEVRDGRLAGVQFGNQSLPKLIEVSPLHARRVRPLTGRMGLYLLQSSGVFRQPMFRFTRENAP
jgi:hypothetical protein